MTAPTLKQHLRDLLLVATPLALAQLAQMAMGVTDTILVGALGPAALAAGGLGANLFFTLLILLQSVLTSAGVLVAESRGAASQPGARPAAAIADVYATGTVLGLLLAVPAFLLMGALEPLLLALDEPPGLAADVGAYGAVLRWGMPGALAGLGLMRVFLPAIGRGRLLLFVTVPAIGLNGALNYGLILGRWGLPDLGLLGSATATAITLTGMAAALLAWLHGPRATRRVVAGGRVRWALLGELAWLGWPVGVAAAVEVTLFLATGLLIGRIGAAALAAHQIALSVAATCFMVPLAISQAANLRVGFHAGARRPQEARRAGFAAMALAAGFMAMTGSVLLLAPRLVTSLFLDVADPANAPTVAMAVSLLAIAALFQVADGVQVVAAGSLRGLRDVRVPMLMATFGYWGLGFVAGGVLAFPLGLGPRGLWLGLAAGLGSVALLLALRFDALTRPTPTPGPARLPGPLSRAKDAT